MIEHLRRPKWPVGKKSLALEQLQQMKVQQQCSPLLGATLTTMFLGELMVLMT